MGAFWGLPDFGARQATDRFELYRSFEPGPYLLWPSRLEVGWLDSGRPDFQIVMVRASGAAADYGVLDLGLERQQDTDSALAFLRGVDTTATIAMVPLQSGFIRLVAGLDLVNIPPDLLAPTPLGWGGIDATRWIIQVTADAATILKEGLTTTLSLTARAEGEVLGVASRVGCTAVFDPAALMGALLGPGASSRRVPRAAFDDFFNDAPANLPSMRLEGDPAPDRAAFAQAMADRARMQYGNFVPAPAGAGSTYVELAADIPSGTVRWDLSEPTAVLRPWVFTLDPFEAARTLARVSGIDALYREVTTAPLALGFFDIDAQAYLPSPRLGLVDAGVVIQVPAKPPLQPQAQSQTVSFQAPADRGVAHLRIAPLEKLSYVYRTFVDVIEGATVRRLDSEAKTDSATTLRLQSRDLPVDLPQFSAEPALLAMATLDGTLAYTTPTGLPVTTAFSLTAAQPLASAALPRDAVAASLTLDAKPVAPGDATPLRLGPMPAAAQHFTLGSFAEYGLQTISIECAFGPQDVALFSVDLRPDAVPESPSSITTFYLTRDRPTATWTYVTSSPFQAGYRWRPHAGGSWSAPFAAGAPLQVQAPAAPVFKPQVWDIGGVHLLTLQVDPPDRVRYVPGNPSPKVDDHGLPAMSLVDTGALAILSLDTRLDLTDAERNDLEVALLPQLEGVERIDFQPASFAVGAVTLSVGDGTGNYQPLASTPSMGTPPYNASFSLQLRGDQRQRALAAFSGGLRLLKVDYPLSLPTDLAATFAGAPTTLLRSADVAAWLPGGSSLVQKVGA
jgi:hypothetical protein